MVNTEGFRQFVSARAHGACEYCQLVEAACGVTFHIEHVLPQSRGGETELANLALSCPGCNLAKGGRTICHDAEGRETVIYNPRLFEPAHLGWHLHFALDRETGIVSPRSSVGEATITMLNMNAPARVFARKLQIQAGLIG